MQNMNDKNNKIPVLLILLDMVGAALVAVGILGILEEGDLSDYLLVIGGLVLMLPLVLHILARIQGRRS